MNDFLWWLISMILAVQLLAAVIAFLLLAWWLDLRDKQRAEEEDAYAEN